MPEDGRVDRLAVAIAALEPLREFTHQPGWAVLDAVLADEEDRALQYVVEAARSHEEFLAYRARVKVLRWVRGLPEGTARQVEEIHAEMDRLEQEDEDA